MSAALALERFVHRDTVQRERFPFWFGAGRMRAWLTAILFLLGIRLVSLGFYPLMDTTEARYGEIARIMVETRNWLTPMFDYGVPFWGKPPLHTWMSAASAAVLGVSEFALRLPHWLAGVGVVILVVLHARDLGTRPLVSAFVLASMIGFIASAGIVMTDMALALGLTVAMLGSWQVWQGRSRYSYVVSIGLAIGLLAKGPIVVVLYLAGLLPWLVRERGIGRWLGQLNVLGFTIVLLALSLPWFIATEIATPGFLDYFIWGEHFARFLDPGWAGDLYGKAHPQLRGTILVDWLYMAAPWSVVLPWILWRERHSLAERRATLWFLGPWAAAPVVLFLPAANILPAYVLPGLPPLALLVGGLMNDADVARTRRGLWIAPAVLAIVLFVVIVFVADKRSDRTLLADRRDYRVYYLDGRTFSGRFYTAGKARDVGDDGVIAESGPFYLVARSNTEHRILTDRACEVERAGERRSLYLCGTR